MLEKFLIKKYLKFDKSQPFISISAILAFIGVAIGIMVLLITMAIMNGTIKQFEDKLFTMNYPLTIYPFYGETIDTNLIKKIEENFPNMILSPYVQTQIINKKGSSMEGGVIFGIDIKKESRINDIFAKAVKGKDLSKFGVIIGKQLYEKLLLKDNDRLMMIFTESSPTGIALVPKMKRFKVKGYFESGLIAYDKAYLYSDIISIKKILNYDKDKFDGIHIYSDDAFEDIKKLKIFLKDYNIGIVGWWQQNGNFFSAFEMEKRALFIVLMLIILVASLNIISSLLMTVMNRRKEIALLLSLGATPKEIKTTFLYLGVIIGGAGLIVGIGLGFLGMFILENFDIITLPADVYGSTKLPINLSTIDLLLTIIGASVIIILSSYYPAKKATEIDVLTVLRNE